MSNDDFGTASNGVGESLGPDLVKKILEANNEDYWAKVRALQMMNGQTVVAFAINLTRSAIPSERQLGADILAQIERTTHSSQEEVLSALLDILGRDDNPDVLYSALVALGHYSSPSIISAVVRFLKHPVPVVREGVAYALNGYSDQSAISALVELCYDPDRDVRDWASYALSSELSASADSPELRNALRHCLMDDDNEIRAQAMLGLALRKDKSVLDALIRELSEEVILDDVIEAARELADSNLCPVLFALRERRNMNSDLLEDAILACKCASSPS